MHKKTFIPTTRKTSVSEWGQFIKAPTEILTKILIIRDQINEDYKKMKLNLDISDLSIVLPRTRNLTSMRKRTDNYDVSKLVGKDAEQYLSLKVAESYCLKYLNIEDELKSRMVFNKILATLSSYYHKREEEKFNIDFIYKQARSNTDKWCSLSNRPLSKRITEPMAMPVQEAPLEELKDFFNFLSSGGKIEPNFYDRDRDNMCMKFTRGALYTDGRLDMCKQVVGPSHIEMLMNSLSKNTTINHFLLGNNIIDTIGAKSIANFIINHPNHTSHIFFQSSNKMFCNGQTLGTSR